MRDHCAILAAALAFAVGCGPAGRDEPGGNNPDAGTGSNTGGGDGGTSGGTVYVYAHTASALYRVDPDTLDVQLVGDFDWGAISFDQMTDIAIDKTGQMIGISFTRVYRVDPSSAKTTLLSGSLSGQFNGLSFVPAEMLGETGDDVLVGTRNTDGRVFRIDPTNGITTEVGDMGNFRSSGDLVAVAGFGTAQTVVGASSDVLALLAPQSFAANPIGAGTGFSQIWGVAFWGDKVYGFTNNGEFVLIDPNTGIATMVGNKPGLNWWGAAVTTLAPVLQ